MTIDDRHDHRITLAAAWMLTSVEAQAVISDAKENGARRSRHGAGWLIRGSHAFSLSPFLDQRASRWFITNPLTIMPDQILLVPC